MIKALLELLTTIQKLLLKSSSSDWFAEITLKLTFIFYTKILTSSIIIQGTLYHNLIFNN